ncbi:hypothetical protein [Streptomyces sp. C10-9-1]|uniref:hypothetical protein n=1 Tax=Streptomyces sp. C10-9-1 TaxID=1859285 RepID=UPI003D7555B4
MTTPTDWYQAPGANRLQVFSADLSNHPDRLQSVSLNYLGTGKLRQRLWNVNVGATVRVAFSDSASTLAACTPAEVADGQRYRVSAYEEITYANNGQPVRDGNEIARTVHHSQDYTTPGYSKEPNTQGSGAWSPTPKVFEFVAAEDNPLVVFESLEENGTSGADASCGPLITAVSAEEQAAPVDHRIEQNDMPGTAYSGVDEISMQTAANTCRATPRACRFTVDPRYTYQYFAANRILDGYAYLNCTRNPVPDRRTVTWTEEGFDSISQRLNQVGNDASVDQNLTNTRQDDVDLQTAGTTATAPNALFAQVAAGFQRNEGNTNLVNTTNPLTSLRTSTKEVETTVQPGEASWIEVQAARERIEGLFRSTGTGTPTTIEASFDFPSNTVPDRLYDRSGPLTQDEKKHCLTERPLKVTPDNTGTRSLAPAPGSLLVRSPFVPAERQAESRLVGKP